MTKKSTSGFTRTPNLASQEPYVRSTMSKLVSGFTLTELLVVIAIIGILSSVILSSVTIARGKAANSAVKSNLKNVRNQAEIFYDNNSHYVGMCSDATLVSGLDAAGVASGGLPSDRECNSNSISWAIQAPLKVPDSDGFIYWCMDNNGNSKGENAVLGASVACA